MEKNKFGRYKKTDVLAEFPKLIVESKEGLYTYRELKEELKNTFKIEINWTEEEKIKHIYGYYCSKEIRGCIPVYDIWKFFHTDNL